MQHITHILTVTIIISTLLLLLYTLWQDTIQKLKICRAKRECDRGRESEKTYLQ